MSERSRAVINELIRGLDSSLTEAPEYADLGFILIVTDPADDSYNVALSPEVDRRALTAMLQHLTKKQKRKLDA